MALSRLSVDSSYELDGVEETGEELGRGAYGVVTVVKYKGMRCAAKKLHPPFLEQYQSVLLPHLREKCMLHSQLRHPRIVQFLGYYDCGLPVLVMELLSTDLSRCINHYGVLPKEISYSILHDVALGLQYLHKCRIPSCIIHRDLTADNILLTDDMTAKIGSFLNGIVPIPPQVSHLQAQIYPPGDSVHLPPEARAESFPGEYTKNDVKVDMFSYGVLMVHTLSGQKPSDLSAYELTVLEADRYRKYLEAIGSEHPLMALILQCLNNDPADRPEAREIIETLSKVFFLLVS